MATDNPQNLTSDATGRATVIAVTKRAASHVLVRHCRYCPDRKWCDDNPSEVYCHE